MKRILLSYILCALSFWMLAQTPETEISNIIEEEDEIEATVISSKQSSLPKMKSIKTEVITAAGLCKMACCNLAESFENSASVTVGYSDAITGARQIKILGLSGIYTQMLDENRPVLRGLSAPFGMSYIPGQWLESIQIAKGPSSVINGIEAITGQINLEHRKPTDETPLFINLYGSSDAMYEGNVISALQLNDKWSTILFTHASGMAMEMDHNGDGFRDEPLSNQYNFGNRWLYYDPSGLQIRFGIKGVIDDRLGGQINAPKERSNELWGSNLKNKDFNGFFKIGVPLDADQNSSIALIADYSYHDIDGFFGLKDYNGEQNSVFINILYDNHINENHRIELGFTNQIDNIRERYTQRFMFSDYKTIISPSQNNRSMGLSAEYTYTQGEKLTLMGSLKADLHNNYGFLLVPRASVKYAFSDEIVFRASGGRGYRASNIFADNIGIFSTGGPIVFEDYTKPEFGSEGISVSTVNPDCMEDAWTFGGNLTFYLPIGIEGGNNFLSFDYFRTTFGNQIIVDQELHPGMVSIYNLDGQSFTDTYQADFSYDPFERFNITTTFRYTNAMVNLRGQGLVERPMTSRYKAVLNMQYSTNLNKWTFDFTASLNGPMKLPSIMPMEESPAYPMLYAQITRRFKGIDIYVGGENLTNFRQKDAILNADNPFSSEFNASNVWGPLTGVKFYAGLRYTLWK